MKAWDGKAFPDGTRFHVQVGKGKSAYRTRWTLGRCGQAFQYYNSTLTWGGHKKRFLAEYPDGSIVLIDRYISA